MAPVELVLILLVVVVVALLARSGKGAKFLIAFGAVVLLVMALTWVRTVPQQPAIAYAPALPATPLPPAYQAAFPNRYDAVIDHQAAQATTDAEPLDELWERLNEPRITLPADAASAPEHSAAADVPSARAPSERAPAAVSPPPEATAAADHAATSEAADDHTESPSHEADAVTDPAADVVIEQPPRQRPSWVTEPPRLVGNVHRQVVQAGPYSTLRECYNELRNEMRNAVTQRIQELAEPGGYAYVPDSLYSDQQIARQFLTDQFVEHGDTSVGPMVTVWGLLEFSADADERMLEGWKRHHRREGLAVTAAIAVGVLGVVAGIWLLLQIDAWTRGYYTKRLFLGVPAAIIAIVLLATSV